MSKKAKFKETNIWDGITEDDFRSEDNIEDVDIADYDKEKMAIFFGNISYFRQIPNGSDGLKPVERRILYIMKKLGATPDKKKFLKSAKYTGDTMSFHAHGDGAIYGALVSMAQEWIIPLPYVHGDGNFGDTFDSNGYAHQRYTEAYMSEFGYNCFFKDYDQDCIETLYNEAAGEDEPLALPCRYPVLLLNGKFGIAAGGNFSCIPPFNVNDVIVATKKLIRNPNANIDIYPDFPTGCDIIDDGSNLKTICEAGIGNFRVRAKIDIIDGGKNWELHITNIPWMVNMPAILEKIAELMKSKKISIKDVEDDSTQMQLEDKTRTKIHYIIYVDKSHDPYEVKDKLYKYTQLEKTIHMDTKVVLQGFTIGEGMSIRDIILMWIDTRRTYKRKLYNKKIVKLSADIDFYNIMIDLLSSDKINKTINTIRKSDSSNVHENLMSLVDLTSYQAKRVLQVRLASFTEDTRLKYIDDVKKMTKELDRCEKAARSSKIIDEEILEEMDELKDYVEPRQSELIADSGKVIPNTEHILISTKMGFIKKFLYEPKKASSVKIGALKNGDYPTQSLLVNNLSQVIFFDSIGRCTSIPVYDVPSTDVTQLGTPLYELTKMNGELISMYPYFSKQTEESVQNELNADMNLLTLSADGYFKRTQMEDIRDIANKKNARIAKLRDGDKIVFSQVVIGISNVILYTKKGKFLPVAAEEIPVMSLNSQGLMSVSPDDMDEYIGASILLPDAKYLFVLTEKGIGKKIDLQFMQTSGKRRGKELSQLITLDESDSIAFIGAMSKKATIVTRNDTYRLSEDEIPTLALRAKGKKLIPIPLGTTITRVEVE